MIGFDPSARSAREQLHAAGYVHLKNVLPQSIVVRAGEFADELCQHQHDLPHGRLKVLWKSLQNRQGTSRKIIEINRARSMHNGLRDSAIVDECKKIARFLLGKPAYYSFDHLIYKPPGCPSVHWHQDSAYKSTVKNMRSVHFWIPLQTIGIDLGCMQYIAGSHQGPKLEHVRGSTDGVLRIEDTRLLNLARDTCETHIGDVVVHLPNTIHRSLPNTSTQHRKAWILHFSPFGQLEPLLPGNLLHRYQRSP